jgi:hypothetical protein
MRTAVHHLRRRSIKRAAGRAPLGTQLFPRLRSSMMAGAQRHAGPHQNQNLCQLRVAWSTITPGPMVEDSVMRFKYWPFEWAGFAFCRSAISA